MLSRLVARAVRLPLRLVPRARVMRVLTGSLRGSRWIAGAATHGCWIGTYERLAQRVFQERIRPGDVVYDIGANVGFFTLLASKLVGPAGAVYAFEPAPRNLAYLQDHVRLNEVGNVHVLPIAISDEEGLARFDGAHNPAMGGLSSRGEMSVDVRSLDALCRAGTIPLPNFIKMDIEGGEHRALMGAIELLRDGRPVLLLSTHGDAQHRSCSDLLSSSAYALELLVDGSLDGNYVLLAMPRPN